MQSIQTDSIPSTKLQVLPYLQSRSFDTRQAAAAALGHISQAVGVWDPTLTAPPDVEDTKEAPPSLQDTRDLLSLASFDVMKVLSEGSLLLSSSGNEYANVSSLSAEDLAKAQRDALGKLGLGFGADAVNDIGVDVGAELAAGTTVLEVNKTRSQPESSPSDITKPVSGLPPPKYLNKGSENSDSQASSSTLTSSTTKPVGASSSTPMSGTVSPAASSPASAPPADQSDPYAGLSARERNKLKRKRKTEAKSGVQVAAPPPPTKKRALGPSESSLAAATPVPAEPSSENGVKAEEQDAKVVIDPGAKARAKEDTQGGEVAVDAATKLWAEMEVQAGEWPWRGAVERLSVALVA